MTTTAPPDRMAAIPVDCDLRPCGDGGARDQARSVEIDRNGFEVLDRDECLRLLGTVPIGRVGITTRALPAILPVTFRRDGDRILFRTGEGTKLATATRNTVVSFEVDDFDAAAHTGWSVLVIGVARRIEGDEARALATDLPRWADSEDGHVVAITAELVSGRRLPPDHATDDDRP